jgi:V/A-type H+/Na+-transporting ATPase subunit F
MVEIVAIGEEGFTMGFRLAGIRNVIDADPKDAEAQLKTLFSQQNIGIIITSKKMMEQVNPDMRRMLDESVSPVTVVVSDKDEMGNLRESIKKAIGVDLWK